MTTPQVTVKGTTATRFDWLELVSPRVLIGWSTVIGLLLLWELVVAVGLVAPLYISSPSRIAEAGARIVHTPQFLRDVKASGSAFLYGYGAAIIVAIPLGLAMGWFRRVNHVVGPFVDVLNAVPRLTFIPILILWFGIGIWSKFAVVFLGAVIPIIIASHAGVRTSEARFVLVARSFGASPLKQLTSIVLPGTLPYIFTGLKYASGRALLGVVVGELYASTAGLGHMIAQAGNLFDVSTVFFGVVLFMAAGMAMNSLLSRIEALFDRWRPQEAR